MNKQSLITDRLIITFMGMVMSCLTAILYKSYGYNITKSYVTALEMTEKFQTEFNASIDNMNK